MADDATTTAAQNNTAAATGETTTTTTQETQPQASASTTATATAEGQGAAVTTPEWAASLPEDVRATVAGIESVEAMVKAYGEVKGKVPVVPAKANDYGLKPSEALGEASVKDVAEAFHGLGLTKEQAQGIAKLNETMMATAVDKQMKEGVAQLQGEWKADFDKNLDQANRAVHRFCSPQVVEFMAKTGLVNNPEIVKMFHSIASAMSEDTLVREDKGQGGGNTDVAKLLYPNMK